MLDREESIPIRRFRAKYLGHLAREGWRHHHWCGSRRRDGRVVQRDLLHRRNSIV